MHEARASAVMCDGMSSEREETQLGFYYCLDIFQYDSQLLNFNDLIILSILLVLSLLLLIFFLLSLVSLHSRSIRREGCGASLHTESDS